MFHCSRQIPSIRLAVLVAATATVLTAAQGPSKEQTALLVLTEVNGVCTPTKPDVTVSRSLHPLGLKWNVDNNCSGDVDVDVFGFQAVQVGACTAPLNSRPFKEDRLGDRVKAKSKKPFGRNFTLAGKEGCWTYKVKVGGHEFDPRIEVER